jgi:RNA polymerase sigma factor (sigma-70 family)
LKIKNFMETENHNQEEIELWNAFKAGEKRAFDAIYKMYAKVLYNYGCKLIDDKTLVLDSIHDLFLDLWRMRETVSTPDSIKFYLIKSLRNLMTKQNRKSNFSFENDFENFEFRLPPVLDIETETIDEERDIELKDKLQRAYLQLTPNQKEVLNLRYYENFSFEEIAKILSMNVQSVRNLIQRALNKLRELTIITLFLFFLKYFLDLVS